MITWGDLFAAIEDHSKAAIRCPVCGVDLRMYGCFCKPRDAWAGWPKADDINCDGDGDPLVPVNRDADPIDCQAEIEPVQQKETIDWDAHKRFGKGL